MKGTWMEFHAENAVPAFKLSDKTAQLHAPDARAIACKNEVETRVWQHFAHLRAATPEIPALHPKVFHPSGEAFRRWVTQMDVTPRWRRMLQDAAAMQEVIR